MSFTGILFWVFRRTVTLHLKVSKFLESFPLASYPATKSSQGDVSSKRNSCYNSSWNLRTFPETGKKSVSADEFYCNRCKILQSGIPLFSHVVLSAVCVSWEWLSNASSVSFWCFDPECCDSLPSLNVYVFFVVNGWLIRNIFKIKQP